MRASIVTVRAAVSLTALVGLVAAGLADRCEVQVAYAIGVAHPLSINVETFGTSQYSSEQLVELIEAHFGDVRPDAEDVGHVRDLNRHSYTM